MTIPKDWFEDFQKAKNEILKEFHPDQVEEVDEIIIPFDLENFTEDKIDLATNYLRGMSFADVFQLCQQLGITTSTDRLICVENILDFMLHYKGKN